MIKVEYYPSGEKSPLPEGNSEYSFETFEDFKGWVQKYVCVHCLIDFYDCNDRKPKTIDDWLDMGCGCEIGIEDPQDMIDWESEMKLPENFEELINAE